MKNAHAVALGKLGGKSGGRSTSPAKVAAVRRNLVKARKIKLAGLKKSLDKAV